MASDSVFKRCVKYKRNYDRIKWLAWSKGKWTKKNPDSVSHYTSPRNALNQIALASFYLLVNSDYNIKQMIVKRIT